MADEEKPDSAVLERAIQRELAYRNKVQCSREVVEKSLSRYPSFCDWTNTGPISDGSVQGRPAQSPQKIQPLIELPRPPISSPRPQNRMGLSPIKIEPSSGELSGPRILTSAAKDWIGPSKLTGEKFQTRHHSSYEVPPLVPFLHETPRRTPPPKPDLIPRTNMVQKPKLFPGPSIPTKTRSGLKRKAIGSQIGFVPDQNPSPSSINSNVMIKIKKPHVENHNLVCGICQKSCSSPLTLQQHLRGRPHKAKLQLMRMKRNSNWRQPRCDVCQIWCSDRDAMEMHLKGQKHKAKLHELEENGGGGKIVAKKPIRCELCSVDCMNEDLFEMHLKGRKHGTRAALKRRGMV